MSHPLVELFWNYWPYTVLIWNPFRTVLNLPFFPIRLFWWFTEDLWNFIPELMIFVIMQFFFIGYICDGKDCTQNKMILNDTEGPVIAFSFIVFAIFSLQGAIFWLTVGALECALYVLIMFSLHPALFDGDEEVVKDAS